MRTGRPKVALIVTEDERQRLESDGDQLVLARLRLQPRRSETFKLSTDPSWWRRCATSWVCICIRRSTRRCSASTDRPKSKRWTAPNHSCPCGRPGGAPTHDYD